VPLLVVLCRCWLCCAAAGCAVPLLVVLCRCWLSAHFPLSFAHKVSDKTHIVLRAESPALRNEWVGAIASEIEALRASVSPVVAESLPSLADPLSGAALPSRPDFLAFIGLESNARCADCSAAAPRWASVTHQVLICVECAGVHRLSARSAFCGCFVGHEQLMLCGRNLGRHISFVQGLYNDDWTEQSVAALTACPGNQLRNSRVLEYHVPPSILKPNADSTREEKERYIVAKCVPHAFSLQSA
jgi:hypothetical protein